MKVLVTGSEGFLGKHVCRALQARGHAVVGLDSAPGAEIVADIRNCPPSLKVLPIMKLDAIVHLAAVASPNICTANPELAFSVNVLGTQQVLRLALESGARKFVFSSSAHVYGVGPKYLPTDEYHPLFLQNTYTTTKILGEQLCQLFYDNHGLSYTVLRLFNAYGPGQARGYFIPDQIAKAEIAKAGKGWFELQGRNVTKDWVYVTDVADAFVRAISSPFVGLLNVGTGVETDLGNIASIIADAYQVDVELFPVASPTRMCCDRARAEQVLGWRPTVNVQDGLDAIFSDAKARSLVA